MRFHAGPTLPVRVQVVDGGPKRVADPQHLALLQQGVDVWNAWRAKEGGVKVTGLVDMRGDRHLASGDLCRESAPLGQGSRASLLVDLPRDEMALLIELVVHLGMN